MIQTFSTFASSIFLEGLFFLLVGVIIASFIDVFVSKEKIASLIPKNRFLGLLVASLLGFIFPVCECGIVPVVRKLLKKGVPLHLGITLLFSSPIVNIVVLSSTYYAFQDRIEFVWYRFLGGFLISFIAGLIVSFLPQEKLLETKGETSCSCQHHESNKLVSLGQHTLDEFFDTGKYFIIGILIASLMQTIVPRNILTGLGNLYPVSNIFMMGLQYVLSICSTTDAFIAKTFIGQFNPSAIIAFLVFGAMFDIKTTIMLSKVFRKTYIIKLLIIVFTLNLIYSMLIHGFIGGSNV